MSKRKERAPDSKKKARRRKEKKAEREAAWGERRREWAEAEQASFAGALLSIAALAGRARRR